MWPRAGPRAATGWGGGQCRRASSRTDEGIVEPGPHKIHTRAEGYAETATSAIVALGEHKEVDLTLKKNPGITATWWFWTGIGVAVAGGATVAAALLIEKNPSHGDLAPG